MSHVAPLSSAAVELLTGWPLYDNAIVAHGFTPYARDYDVLVETTAHAPGRPHGYVEGRYRFRFTHCVLAEAATALDAETWRDSWGDVLTDYEAWQRAGHPFDAGSYVWGVGYLNAEPGARVVADSPRAAKWAAAVGHPMHEVQIATNGLTLRLVFHSLRVHKVAQGSPDAAALAPIEPVDLLDAAT